VPRTIVATLRDTRNGLTKEYVETYSDEPEPWEVDSLLFERETYYQKGLEDYARYQWLDGNYSCDCNRSLFLYDHDPEKELPCDDGIHRVIELDSLKVNGVEILDKCGSERAS
jgi:hypothetical protein